MMSDMTQSPPPRGARWVSDEPWDPREDIGGGAQRDLDAPSWLLAYRRLRKHRLATISGAFLLALYLLLPFMGFFAPYAPDSQFDDYPKTPPQAVRFFHDGALVGPYVYALSRERDFATFQYVYKVDATKPEPLRFFCSGEKWRLFGLFETRMHLFCAAGDGPVFLVGSDASGRDVFSRLLYGAQLSMTVGLIGVAVSFVIGIILGGLAGYFGGVVDMVVMRLVEIVRSLPELPLWLALSAAVPEKWSPIATFFMISIILGLLDWPGLARAIRSKFLSLREEDFVKAAELMGASSRRIIRRHLLPNFASHLVASATLSIPSMILGETALSFLGLGLREPAVSWGVMLADAQNLSTVTLLPWLAAPMIPVIVVVLAFNFLGDGLRDAMDPYKSVAR
jgi:peptide/nickel transport system permease protein